jgi:hypothetical protein
MEMNDLLGVFSAEKLGDTIKDASEGEKIRKLLEAHRMLVDMRLSLGQNRIPKLFGVELDRLIKSASQQTSSMILSLPVNNATRKTARKLYFPYLVNCSFDAHLLCTLLVDIDSNTHYVPSPSLVTKFVFRAEKPFLTTAQRIWILYKLVPCLLDPWPPYDRIDILKGIESELSTEPANCKAMLSIFITNFSDRDETPYSILLSPDMLKQWALDTNLLEYSTHNFGVPKLTTISDIECTDTGIIKKWIPSRSVTGPHHAPNDKPKSAREVLELVRRFHINESSSHDTEKAKEIKMELQLLQDRLISDVSAKNTQPESLKSIHETSEPGMWYSHLFFSLYRVK